jgi:sec-independent protein translocase protein TatA
VGDIGAPELLIIGVVIVLLFGATRLPATAKGLGQALRLFKKEIRDDDPPSAPAQPAPATLALDAVPSAVDTAVIPTTGVPTAGVPTQAVATPTHADAAAEAPTSAVTAAR